MKKLALLLALSITSSAFGYNFYVLNDGDIPITAALYVKGVIWPWDKVFLVQPGEYAYFETLAYCGGSVVINDGRATIPKGNGTFIKEKTFQIPWQTSCHMHQIITVKAMIEDQNQTDAYYSIYGRKYTYFDISYNAYLTGKVAEGIVTSKARSGIQADPAKLKQ